MSKLYEKDLNALSDLMNYEQCSYKMCDFYASQLTDPESQELVKGLARCHKTRFESLFEFLNKM